MKLAVTPPPLVIKRPRPVSPLRSILVLALVIVPLAMLLLLAVQRQTVHFDHPVANVVAHLALLAFPMIWARIYFAQPLDVLPNRETVLARGTFWSTVPHTWWMSVLLWPAPLVTFHVLGRTGLDVAAHGAATLDTGPGAAFLIMVLAFAMSVFYGAVAIEKRAVRVSEEGLRVDLVHFLEWDSIHHVTQHRKTYDIYHRANPKIPFAVVPLSDPGKRAIFEEYLTGHGIGTRERPHAAYHLLRATTALAAFVLLELAVAAQTVGDFPGGWIIAVTFGIGLGLTALLERFRRVRKVTRIRPQVELDEPLLEQAPLAEVMEIQDPAEFSITLSTIVFHRFQELGFQQLNQAEQVFHCVDWLEREVNNGGFHQFFSNSAGDLTTETVEALEHIGAGGAAAILRRAVELFPAGGPDRDRAARERQLEAVDRERLDALDDEFYEYPDDIARLLQRYVLAHRDHFEETA